MVDIICRCASASGWSSGTKTARYGEWSRAPRCGASILAMPVSAIAQEAPLPAIQTAAQTPSDAPDHVLVSASINNPENVTQVRFVIRLDGDDHASMQTFGPAELTNFTGRAHVLTKMPCGREITYRVRVTRSDGQQSNSDYGHYSSQSCSTDRSVQQEYAYRQAERQNAEFREEVARAENSGI